MAGKLAAAAKPAAKPAATTKAAATKAAATRAAATRAAVSKAGAKKPAAPAKPAPAKPVSKPTPKPDLKKPAAKADPKKAAAPAKAPAKPEGKIDPKKIDPKKVDPKKVDSKKVDSKKPDSNKPDSKKPDPRQPDSSKSASSKPAAPAKAPAGKQPAPAPAGKPAAKSAAGSAAGSDSKKGAAPSKADAKKGAGGPMDPPSVPKKGPIDLAQHKSVAAAAAALVTARGEGDGFVIINGRRVRAISTKGMSVAKKSKATAVEAPAAPTEQQIKSIKTKLSKKELDEYRSLLLAKRKQLVGMLSGMEDEALRSSGGNLSNMPVHMADMGSDVYDQDFTLGMAETERAILGEIDAALQRIEDKTFGVCQMTGKPISKARLDAKPWAKYTIEAERIAETGGGR
ncbi:MAG: TraR/DksA family transcriptional regulator [Planctomycetota bacterium]